MTVQKADADERTLFISPAGNDDSLGEEIPKNFKTVERLEQALSALSPLPDQNNQAGALCLTRGRFQPDTAYSPLDWTQNFMPVATIAGDSPTRDLTNAVVRANSFALLETTGISSYPGQWALDIDNVLAFGATQKAMFSFGGLGVVLVTNNSADIFLRAGQIGTTTEGAYIDTKGGGAVIANYDVVDLNADNARGYYVDTNGGNSTVSMAGNLIRRNMGTSTATALQVDGGINISFNYQHVQGNILINNGEVQANGQALDDNLTINNGEVEVSYQKISGDVEVSGGNVTIDNLGKLEGSLNQTGGTLRIDVNEVGGAATFGNGVSVVTAGDFLSDVTLTSGLHWMDVRVIVGNFTVDAGAVVQDSIIGSVLGTINILGVFNGRIADTLYGTWVDGTDRVNTFLRDGTIPTSWETTGAITIDTTTDTITNFQGSYSQTSGGPRTVNFRVIDADTLDVYYTGTSATIGASPRYYQDLTPTATPLPSDQEVNLLLQNERSGPGGVNGGGGQIEYTRINA